MAGIYIHIPFCRKNCYYCDFYFSVSLAQKDDIVGAIKQEMQLRADEGEGQVFETIYFGGGTPSVLTVAQIRSIIITAKTHFPISQRPEITLEANPEDLSRDYLAQLKNAGIDRLSIGIQSFDNDDLTLMNRSHVAGRSLEAVNQAHDVGFHNINIDLIYGLPEMSLAQWEQNLVKALQMPVQHISAYHLTIEPNTIFGHWAKKGKIKSPADELSNSMFQRLIDLTAENGYIQYEISNFGKPDFFSKHNLIYWKGDSYLGFGPSAHSYNQQERRWNIRSINRYINLVQSGEQFFEKEMLDKQTRYNEYIMTGLRTQWGCNLSEIQEKCGYQLRRYAEIESKKFTQSGHLLQEGKHLKLTGAGRFIADYIISNLMKV